MLYVWTEKKNEHFQIILCLQFSFFLHILYNYANSFNDDVGPFNFDNCFCAESKFNKFIATCKWTISNW
jgi:hypothetical protein